MNRLHHLTNNPARAALALLALSIIATGAIAETVIATLKVGIRPRAAAINTVTDRIYVLNSEGTVTVINGATPGVVATVRTGPFPNGIAVNETTNKVYVPNFLGNSVTVIDGATNATTTIPAGTGPSSVAVDPRTNRIYVPNSGSNDITVIDGATNATMLVPAGPHPLSAAVNSTTNRVYITNYGADSITIVDGSTLTSTQLTVGREPGIIAINAVTNRIYVATIDGVKEIDGATNGIVQIAPASARPVVDTVGNRVFLGPPNLSADRTIVQIYDASQRKLSTLSIGDPASTDLILGDFNPPNGRLYIANFAAGIVYVLDTRTMTTEVVQMGVPPRGGVFVNPVTGRAYTLNTDVDTVTVLAATPSASRTDVNEYYNRTQDRYFITADVNEQIAILGGSAGPGWTSTGGSFKSGGSTGVCRFYGSLSPGPNSHFYTMEGAECAALIAMEQVVNRGDRRWNFESIDFTTTPPAGGSCPASTQPVCRAYNNGFARGIDSNHRFSVRRQDIDEVVSRGWIDEGVVMCAPI